MTRKLIVTADDLGTHEAINRGILEAHEEGIVTAASIVPCGRAFDHACRLVEKRRKLDVGIAKAPLAPAQDVVNASHLMIANPFRAQDVSRLFGTHPPMAERIARLQAQARGMTG